MLSEGELQELEEYASLFDGPPGWITVKELIAEVRRLQNELTVALAKRDTTQDHWDWQGACERAEAQRDLARDEAEEWRKIAARAVQVCDVNRAELDRVNARHMADADALLKERERADNLYRLSREGGFRPRWIAESEVAK